ncbi:MAG: hypothetical protein ACK4UW_20450 [Rhizobium rhizophilum]|uniref:hypothetical protein n=1 Tax=Rhizobium rhizophilum TaxID=1850373 RepID=UPI00391D758E
MHASTNPTATSSVRPVTLPHVTLINGPKPLTVAAPAAPKSPKTGTPHLILVGLDDQGKPHASWFTRDQTDAAAVAADLMQMALLQITTPELTAIAAGLPKGKLFESGKAFVPFVKRSVYDQLAAHLTADFLTASAQRVEAAKAAGESYTKASKGEVAMSLPEDWSKLAVGDTVLATESADDGWWFAEIVELPGEDKVRLRWRDFPEYPTMTVGMTEIALLHPQYVQR